MYIYIYVKTEHLSRKPAHFLQGVWTDAQSDNEGKDRTINRKQTHWAKVKLMSMGKIIIGSKVSTDTEIILLTK